MNTLLPDLRHAFRSFLRQPGTTLLIVLTLAVGIGANSAIFSYLLEDFRPQVRAPEPDRLFHVLGGTRENPPGWYALGGLSYQDAGVYREALAELGDLSLWAFYGAVLGLPGEGDAAGENIYRLGVAVSPQHFDHFGVRFALGRGFLPEENRPEGRRVAVVDHTFWRRYLGADPAAVGKTIRVNRVPFIIVGVTPRGFQNVAVPFPIYIPIARLDEVGRRAVLDDPRARRFAGLLRLSGETGPAAVEALKARLALVANNLDREDPLEQDQERRAVAYGVEDSGSLGSGQWMLVGSVALLLLLACANVANLQLARAARRRREIAVLAALGAGRRQIAARLLTENAVLALAGATLGIAVAHALIVVIKRVGWVYPVGFGTWGEGIEWMQVDNRVLALTLVVTLLTGALSALAPILHAARTDLVTALKSGAGETKPGRRVGPRQLLVIVQVTLSTVLLLGAGLLVRSLHDLQHRELGFETEHQLLAVLASTPAADSSSPAEHREQQRQLYELGRRRLAELPDVRTATLTSTILGSDTGRTRLVLPSQGDQALQVDHVTIGHDFFDTFGIELMHGRAFNTSDSAGGVGAVIVNQTFAERFLGGAHGPSVLGHELRLPDLDADTAGDRFVIVGMAADVHHASPREEPAPLVFLSFTQNLPTRMVAVARTSAAPRQVMGRAREALTTAHPDLALVEIDTYDRQIAYMLSDSRLYGGIAGVFSLFGLALAALGIYSVIRCAVSYRRRELGVRMALGATASVIVRLVLGEAFQLVAAGILLGVVAALALSRFLTSLLYGVAPHDPGTFLALPLLLAVIALTAAAQPAWHAGRLDPKTALQEE